MNTHNPEDSAIPLSLLLAAIWRNKLIIMFATLLGVFVGTVLYFARPRVFEEAVDIWPLRASQFSAYSSLIEAGVFPKAASDLRDRYVLDLRDTAYVLDLRDTAAVSLEKIDLIGGETAARIKFHGGDPGSLDNFIRQAILRTSKQLFLELEIEAKNRVQAMRDAQDIAVLVLMTKITAAKQEADAKRLDMIARLREEAIIAKSLEIEKPIVVQSVPITNGQQQTPSIGFGVPQNYLQGYKALDQQIQSLEKRDDNSPYVDHLRSLERQLYEVKNDPKPNRILSILAERFSAPDKVDLVRVDLSGLRERQVSPRLFSFIGAGLLFGLMFGVVFAAIRGVSLIKRASLP